MQTLKLLSRSRKFWLAAFGVVQTIIFQFVPDFPQSVWLSIDALVGVLITAIAAEDIADKTAAPLHRTIDHETGTAE